MDIEASQTKSHTGRIAFVAILHLAGMTIGAGGIIWLEKLIPTGHEGGWLTRIYVGLLFAMTVLINFILLIVALFKRGISVPAVVVRIIPVAAPVLLAVWRLLRRG